MPRILSARKLLPLLVFMMLLILAATWLLVACSSDYQTADTTSTPTALVSAATLKSWIDQGKVNGTGYDRVVILDVNNLANYTAGHVPGAHFLDSSEIYQVRREGPANDINMVIDGSHMNALVRKYGIDDKTTILFTAGTGTTGGLSADKITGAYLTATRAYWTFRYWGFSRERLKLLDGINWAWKKDYDLSTAPPPAVTPSTFSITSNKILRSDLRVSLAEMIQAAEGNMPNSQIVDFRSGETGNSFGGQRGKTAGIFTAYTGTVAVADAVVFEGHINGAHAMSYMDFFDSGNDYHFKSASNLVTLLTDSAGLNSTVTALVH